MQAKDIMSKKPEFLPPTATLTEVAKLMAKQDFGFVPIGENDRLIGAVTDRDIIIRAIAKGKDPNKTLVKDVLSEGIQYCFDVDDLEKLAQHMEEQQIRRLVVLNKEKRMVGIVSLGDIFTKSKNAKLSLEIGDAVSQHEE